MARRKWSGKLSTSFLNLLEQNPAGAWEKMTLGSPKLDIAPFRIGSAVDVLLTDPDSWEKEFVVVNKARPSGMMDNFVGSLPAGITSTSSEDEYAEAYESSGYKIPIKRVIDNFWRYDGYSFYNLIHNETRTILSPDEMETIQNVVDSILNSEASEFFVPANGWEIRFQDVLEWEYLGEPCIGILDGVMVNERLGIVRPYDLKTTSSPVWQFRKSFEKYNYFRQAAFYTYALANTENFADYKDFTWEPFKFVVAQKKKDTPPIVYEVTQNDLHCGRWGGRLRKNNVKLKGFHNLIEDYQWHVQTEVWDMPRTEYLNKGKLDVFQLETKEINNLI